MNTVPSPVGGNPAAKSDVVISNEVATALAIERRKFAKMLHDGLCQDLMGATLLAQVHADNLAGEKHAHADEAIAVTTILKRATDEFMKLYAALEPPGAYR